MTRSRFSIQKKLSAAALSDQQKGGGGVGALALVDGRVRGRTCVGEDLLLRSREAADLRKLELGIRVDLGGLGDGLEFSLETRPEILGALDTDR